jgi:hypothetical protein
MNYTLEDLVKIGVQNGQYPRYIYRYRPINAFFDDILLKNSLWFSNPKDFNDPFDCRVLIDTNNTSNEIKDFLKRNGVNEYEATMLATNVFNQPKEFDKMVNEVVEQQISKSGICCFSQLHDNILMWSHYSDSHKGVCLKYDIINDPSFFVFPVIVNYQNQYSTFNYFREEKQIIDKLIRTKSLDWSYEKEIRILKLNQSGLITFKREALVEIIFGCKTNSSEINRIKRLAIDNGYKHLLFKLAKLKTNEYGLDFENI